MRSHRLQLLAGHIEARNLFVEKLHTGKPSLTSWYPSIARPL